MQPKDDKKDEKKKDDKKEEKKDEEMKDVNPKEEKKEEEMKDVKDPKMEEVLEYETKIRTKTQESKCKFITVQNPSILTGDKLNELVN